MAQDIEMPALGESVTEGTVSRWLKKVGDKVAVDEPLLEVSTDKVDSEVPSPIAGVVTEIVSPQPRKLQLLRLLRQPLLRPRYRRLLLPPACRRTRQNCQARGFLPPLSAKATITWFSGHTRRCIPDIREP